MCKPNKDKEAHLKIERVRELVVHDSAGKFFNIKTRGRVKAGSEAGYLHKTMGYNIIEIDGVKFYAHRLVWLYHYGVWPAGVIDHVNGDKTDNRIDNIRDVSQRTNLENQAKYKRADANLPTGVSVSTRAKDSTPVSYQAYWRSVDGKLCRSPAFNIKKCGGEENAIAQAAACRESKISELNNLGANYTETHGK